MDEELKAKRRLNEELRLISNGPLFYGVLREYIPKIAVAILPKDMSDAVASMHSEKNQEILRFGK